jgi:hypothetical protein
MGDNGERVPVCPLCGEPVRDQKTAITTPDARSPAHFDCVLQDLARREGLQPGEKITYLGRGTFGIVSYRSGSGGTPFAIRKRIPYEPPAPGPGGEPRAQ